MRQGQHNKNRSRGRGGSNRGGGGGGRSSNPLNRVYESNGPDVKVRGNAQTIAEKYLQLARDAVSSGENVNAENYYQHAEHYLRIVSAAQAFNQQNQQVQQEKQAQQNQQRGENGEGDADNQKPSEADGSSDQATSGDDGSEQQAERSNNRNNNRRARSNGRGRSGSEQAADGGDNVVSEKGDHWQAQAPDFLRRETPGTENEEAVQSEPKPKRPTRARKPKAVKAEVSDDASEPTEDVSAA